VSAYLLHAKAPVRMILLPSCERRGVEKRSSRSGRVSLLRFCEAPLPAKSCSWLCLAPKLPKNINVRHIGAAGKDFTPSQQQARPYHTIPNEGRYPRFTDGASACPRAGPAACLLRGWAHRQPLPHARLSCVATTAHTPRLPGGNSSGRHELPLDAPQQGRKRTGASGLTVAQSHVEGKVHGENTPTRPDTPINTASALSRR
jgi:hypothetical protein